MKIWALDNWSTRELSLLNYRICRRFTTKSPDFVESKKIYKTTSNFRAMRQLVDDLITMMINQFLNHMSGVRTSPTLCAKCQHVCLMYMFVTSAHMLIKLLGQYWYNMYTECNLADDSQTSMLPWIFRRHKFIYTTNSGKT